MHQEKNLLFLAGNGLSISYNEDLKLQKITKNLMGEIEKTTEVGAPKVIKEIRKVFLSAERDVENWDTNDFEELVGSFDLIAKSLSLLGQLAESFPKDKLIRFPEINNSIENVKSFADFIGIIARTYMLDFISNSTKYKKKRRRISYAPLWNL